MARPVEIDREQAFDAASELFWRQGYQSTSLQDLLKVTGMGRSSFYAAFQSKEALFESVVCSYGRDFTSLLEKIRAREKGLTAIRTFLDRTLIGPPDSVRCKGCLLVNSVLELEGVDERLHRLAVEYLGELDHAVIGCLEEAERAGQLRDGVDVTAVGRLLTSLIEGWRVASRAGATRQELLSQIEQFLALIENDQMQTRRSPK